MSRFAPLNRYYVIIDEVFFDNFLVIIYLLIVCKKTNNSFILVYFNYLFITSCIQKKIIHSFWSVEYCWTQKGEYFSQKKIIVKGFRFTYVYGPGTNGNRGETTQGANGIRGETTRYPYFWCTYFLMVKDFQYAVLID